MANKRIHAVFSAQELMPLEIWTQCLFEACHGPNYMAKLLNLTTVSKKWNEVIMRIQTLWAYINVNESDEDSEATIALFLHLSGKTQLTLAISMPLSGHWSAILNLLYPHKARIRNIILISTKDTPMSCYQYKSTSDSGDSEPGWVLNRVIEELDLFAMKQKFNITSDIPLQPEMLLPSSVQLPSGNWLILSASFGTTSLKKRGRRFIKPHQIALSIVNLPDIGRYSSTLGHLEHLHIVSETHDYVKAPPTYVDSTISLRFPLLTTLQYHARFQPALSQLITARSRLQYLDIQIGILDVIGVIDALEVATSLRGFTLTLLILEYDLDASGKKRPYYPRNITNTISKKRTPSWCLINVEKFKCEIKHYEGKEVPGTLHVDYLWRVFHAIFPNLRHLVWNLPMQSRTLLTSLSRQKQLTHFESMAVPPSSYNQGTRVTLSSLESLSVNDARIFDGVGISNLSHLSMRWYDEFEIPAGIGLMQLQSLTIATGNNVKRPVKISPKDFPLLQSISITFHGPRSSFNLPDLPNLIEVRISTRFPAFTQGIKLCTSLMCEPEICPKLERIHLDSFIQWDILFVLLKRRNFGRSPAISKIRELGLPQVAPRFRSVLTSLLQQQEAPSDLIFYRVLEELPIWQAQRRLLDENIAGCVHCVYMGTPGCQEPVKPPRFPFEYEKDNRKDQNSSIVELYELFSVPEWGASGKTPITCSVHDQGWMEKCTGDVLMWEIMAREWSKLHHRTFMCHKRPSANLVTSDHDIIVEECSRGMDLESLLTELQSITKSCAGAPYDNNSVEKLVDTVRGCLSAGRKGPVHNARPRYVAMLSNPRFFKIFMDRQSITGRAIVLAVKYLAKNDDFTATLRLHIAGMLMSDRHDVRQIGTTIMAELTQHTELFYEANEIISKIFSSIDGNHVNVQMAPLRAVSELVLDAKLCHLISSKVAEIIDMLKDGKDPAQPDAMETLKKLAMHAELHHVIHENFPRVTDMLRGESLDVQSNALRALTKAAECSELRSFISPSIPRVVEMLKDENSDIGSSVDTLTRLARHPEFRPLISLAIPQVVKMLSDKNDYVRASMLYALVEFAKHAEFFKSIDSSIPQFVNMLRGKIYGVRSGAINTLTKLADHTEFRHSISSSIPQVINMLKDESYGARSSAVNVLAELVKHAEFRNAILSDITRILEKLDDEDCDVRSSTFDTLTTLAEHAEFRNAILPAIPRILDRLNGEDCDVRSSTFDTLTTLAEHAEFRNAILPAIPRILEKLNDEDYAVRSMTVHTLSTPSKHAEFRNAILPAITRIVEKLNDEHYDVRSRTVHTLSTLSKHAEFRNAILPAITRIVEKLDDEHYDVRSRTVNTLSTLSKHAEFRNAILPAIPRIVDMLDDEEYWVRSTTIAVLSTLAEHAEFRNAILLAIPRILEKLNDEDYAVRSMTVHTLSTLSKHAEFRNAILPAIPRIVDMLDDEAHWMQSNAVDALSTLAEHTEFRNAIFPVIPQMIDMLDGKEYSVRSSTVEALHKLAELTRCRNPIPRRDGFKMDWSPII